MQRSSTTSGLVREQIGDLDSRFAVLLERPLAAQQARGRVDVLILHVAELGRPLLSVQFIEQRLRIECLQMRRAARHEHEDEGLRLSTVRLCGGFGASGL